MFTFTKKDLFEAMSKKYGIKIGDRITDGICVYLITEDYTLFDEKRKYTIALSYVVNNEIEVVQSNN